MDYIKKFILTTKNNSLTSVIDFFSSSVSYVVQKVFFSSSGFPWTGREIGSSIVPVVESKALVTMSLDHVIMWAEDNPISYTVSTFFFSSDDVCLKSFNTNFVFDNSSKNIV